MMGLVHGIYISAEILAGLLGLRSAASREELECMREGVRADEAMKGSVVGPWEASM